MREVRFTEEQMVAIMREADREPVAVGGQAYGISEQTAARAGARLLQRVSPPC